MAKLRVGVSKHYVSAVVVAAGPVRRGTTAAAAVARAKAARVACTVSRGSRLATHTHRGRSAPRSRVVRVRATAGVEVADPTDELLQPGQWKLREEGTVHAESFLVRSCEVGPERDITAPSLLRLMQECATNHALRVGLASEDGYCVDETMAAQNLIWVLTKMRLQIDKYPQWGEAVEVRTWFDSSGRMTARRDWEVLSVETGERLAGATSTWVLVNTETRRIARFPPHMKATYEDKTPSYPKFALGEEAMCQKIPEVEECEICVPGLRARSSDVDMNYHINNVTYLEWILDAVPDTQWKDSTLREVDLEWCAEGKVDELVDSNTLVDPELDAPGEVRFVHGLVQGETTLFRSRTRWVA